MKSGYRFTLVLSVCLLLLAPIVVAQTTGTIEGTVTDQNGGPLPGVTVEITSPNLQGTRTATTGNDGRFRFVSVPPGQYKVTGNLSGMGAAAKNATVTLDSTATANLQMQVSAKEAITVTGEAPLIDTASTTTGTNYSAKVMEKLPLGANYASIVLSQPGVQTDNGETQGRALAVSIYGSTSAENLWIIDGVNTTNVIKGFQGKAINGEFIQEVEVKTGGYQAEYGRNTGGVINVVTKSGGNEFHGDLFGYYNSPGMSANPRFDKTAAYARNGDALNTPGNIVTPQDRREGGVDLGGYAWKDRIWFFGAFDRTLTDDNVVPLTGALSNQQFNQHFLANLWAGKLTFNVAQGTTIVGTIFADPQVNTGAILVPTGVPGIPPDPRTYQERRDVGGTDYAGRLNQLFGSFGILTAQYSHHTDRFTTQPGPGAGIRITDTTPGQHSGACPPGFGTSCTASIATGGPGNIFGPTINNQSKRDQYSGSFTGYAGNMEIKIGGDYQKDDTFGATYRPGGQSVSILTCTGSGTRNCNLALAPKYTNPLGDNFNVFYQHSFYTANGTDLTPLVTAPFDTPSKRTGAFIQNQWRIIPTLTVNAGLRWDQDESDKGNGEVAFKLKNEWAPRLGFVWDFVGDGTSKLYGSYGRFFYSIPTDLNARVFTANTAFNTFNYSPTSLIQDPTAPRARNFQVGTFDGEPVDPNLKAPYQDEFTIGIEKALDPTLSLGLKGTYRTLGRTVEDRCDLDSDDPLAFGNTCAIFNPGSASVANGGIKSCNGSENPTDPTSNQCGLPAVAVGPAKRIFRGIELTARKQFSQVLWAQASYLYSTLRGNYSGAIREGDGQTDPGINADYDYNQFLINAYGDLELDRPHQLRLDAVYNAPFGLSVGFQAYARSGVPTSRTGRYNTNYPFELFLDPRGSDGRLPTDYEANISLAYNLNIGPVTVTPQLYIFNLLNRQTITGIDQRFNPNGSYVTTKTSPFFGQNGVEPGKKAPDGTLCPADSTGPCSDNQDYRKVTTRTGARFLRAALKITF
jgi:carboxypeptidase family protein/TonB-dependent receptor-like protein